MHKSDLLSTSTLSWYRTSTSAGVSAANSTTFGVCGSHSSMLKKLVHVSHTRTVVRL